MKYIDVKDFYKRFAGHGTKHVSLQDYVRILSIELLFPRIVDPPDPFVKDDMHLIELNDYSSKLMELELAHVQTDDGREAIQILNEMPVYIY